MSILLADGAKVIVQGITGREGVARTKLMLGYGTHLVGGVTPGRGGEVVEGLPVFATVKEAAQALGGIDASVLFIPGPGVKDAALEALNNGVKLLVIVPDRVPVQDVLEISAASRDLGAHFVGPNTLGVLSPDRWVLGMMGGRAESARQFFKRGVVGVTSRSGGITSSIAYYLGQAGVGASTIVHVGGDPVVGLPHPAIARLFQDDPETQAIVMFGEIGGSQEEQVAELIATGVVTKPVIAYIGGKGAKEGTRFSHAGAIIEGGRGTREGKIEALSAAGATVVEDFDELPRITKEVLKSKGILL
jgi:succinyl-CoA synthetase alpha subunit